MAKQEIMQCLGDPRFQLGAWIKKVPVSAGNVDVYFHPRGFLGSFRTKIIKNVPESTIIGPVETEEDLRYFVMRGENGTRQGLEILQIFLDDTIDRLQKSNVDLKTKVSLESLARVRAEKGAKKKVADISEVEEVKREKRFGEYGGDDFYYE